MVLRWKNFGEGDGLQSSVLKMKLRGEMQGSLGGLGAVRVGLCSLSATSDPPNNSPPEHGERLLVGLLPLQLRCTF